MLSSLWSCLSARDRHHVSRHRGWSRRRESCRRHRANRRSHVSCLHLHKSDRRHHSYAWELNTIVTERSSCDWGLNMSGMALGKLGLALNTIEKEPMNKNGKERNTSGLAPRKLDSGPNTDETEALHLSGKERNSRDRE